MDPLYDPSSISVTEIILERAARALGKDLKTNRPKNMIYSPPKILYSKIEKGISVEFRRLRRNCQCHEIAKRECLLKLQVVFLTYWTQAKVIDIKVMGNVFILDKAAEIS
ncbi:MAG TPA: hypothetical protein VL122_12950 [Nitrospirota bacterium]|nr:hypothetical protein [Nitrospirota bacterium]